MTAQNEDIQWLTQEVENLQTKLAFQEDTVQALNDALAAQQRQIDHLTLHNRRLVERIDQIIADIDSGPGPVNEKPPHY